MFVEGGREGGRETYSEGVLVHLSGLLLGYRRTHTQRQLTAVTPNSQNSSGSSSHIRSS